VWRYGRTLCRDGGAGLVGNRPMPGTNLVGLAATELLTPSSPNEQRIQEARKLQCQLKYFALDAGLSVRTAVRVVTYNANGTLQPERNALPVFGPASFNSFAVVVCAQYKTSSRTGLFGSMLNQKILHSRVTMRIATPLANTSAVFPGAVEETPLEDGGNPGNWNNCVPSE
jgi:hypothetical protein